MCFGIETAVSQIEMVFRTGAFPLKAHYHPWKLKTSC